MIPFIEELIERPLMKTFTNNAVGSRAAWYW